ncbi:hypothetical protein [uncultured Subdoligranulum sp.]|uniref:hypothetical protein n=1 Tax=uncultured Subdoligranulum sp. TaxID=512298 RepID=UPI00320A167B
MKKLLPLLFVPLFMFSACGSSGSASSTSVSVPSYTTGESTEYVRDSQKCMAYRVCAGTDLSEDELLSVFHDVTADDGYYLHTVWFYSTSECSGFYDVAMVEELESGSDPVVTLAPQL